MSIPDFEFDTSFLEEFNVPAAPDILVPSSSMRDSDEDVAVYSEPVSVEDEELLRAQRNLAIEEERIAQAEADKERLRVELEKENFEIQVIATELREREERQRIKRVELNQARATANNGARYIDIKRREVEAAIRNAEVRKARESTSDRLEKKAQDFAWFKGVNVGGKTLSILPHQMEASKFIVTGKRVILGDEMGLGKTLSALSSLDLADSKRALIITPADVTSNFLAEAQMWVPNRPVLDFKGKTKHERELLFGMMDLLPSFIAVVNYEMWRKDYELPVLLADLGFDTVIADEAHVMKDITSINFKGVKSIIEAQNICPDCGTQTMKSTMRPSGVIEAANKARRCTDCGRHAGAQINHHIDLTVVERRALATSVKNVILMTGTPILNEATDMFALLNLVDPVTYDQEATYRRMFTTLDEWTGRNVFQTGGMEQMVSRLNGIYMGRSRGDAGIILPEQTPIDHVLTLDEESYPNQSRIIRQLEESAEIVLSNGDSMSTAAAIALITRQRQANVCPSGIQIKDSFGEVVFSVGDEVTESIKLDKALEIIGEQVDAGHRIVLFSQFTTALNELEERLKHFRTDGGKPVRAVTMTGATKTVVRDQVKTNFDRKHGEVAKWDVVLANYKSGGVGLNFTAATQVIILDREWNPGKEDQALARVLRIGQTEETTVHTIEIEGSIDIWLNGLIAAKKEIVDGFKTSSRDMQSELLEILRKKREAREQK